MNPQIRQISAELDAAAERARAIVERIPVRLLGQRPNETCWSVADCIEHLSLTTDAYLAQIARALEEARRRQCLSGRSLLSNMRIEERRGCS